MKYVFGLIAIGVLLIAIILILFTGGPGPEQGKRRIDLAEYADTPATVIYTVEGRLNAEEEHRSIRISVNRNQRTIEVLGGYSETVIKSQDFFNTQSAYDEFLHGLKRAGYTRFKEARYMDEKGVCPLGYRYIYEVEEFSDELLRLWSTSCSKDDGDFGGNANLVRRLFQAQIPEYEDFVRGIKL